MQTYTFKVSDLVDGIDLSPYRDYADIAVQIFCGQSASKMQEVAAYIQEALPQAHIIATTTDGEIIGEEISVQDIVIALSVFDKTEVSSGYVDGDDSFTNGKTLARSLVRDNTKLLILFSDGATCNGEAFLQGISSVAPHVKVAGGMAGDNGKFVQTYILQGNRVLSKGAVGLALHSDQLQVCSRFSFNWSPIGIEHVITKVDKNRIYTIDDMSAVDFYARYLGEEVAEALPATGIEFPLIFEKDAHLVARAAIARNDDSLSFAGNMKEGDRVRLGFGNAEMIMRESIEAFNKTFRNNIETFFIYSCMARRRYMPEFIELEISPYASSAKTVGFFTYGEFYHDEGGCKMLNQTLTVVALSEAPILEQSSEKLKEEHLPTHQYEYIKTIRALTNLVEQSTRDYEAQAKKLEEQMRYSEKLLAAQRLFLRHAVHESNTPLSVMMSNIELFELEYGKNIYMQNIEAALKNLCGIYDDLNYLVQKDEVHYPKRQIDLVDYLRSRIEFFEIVARQVGLTFRFSTDRMHYPIFFNETKLQRIVDNNISNAIKYTHEGETIDIHLQDREEGICLEIASRSIRIEDPSKVFDAYYREIYNKEGLGIGLNLVAKICEEEGVRVMLESTEERTRFGYLFPRAKS
jgi:nitrogen-specific signal transduction histidine kinase